VDHEDGRPSRSLTWLVGSLHGNHLRPIIRYGGCAGRTILNRVPTSLVLSQAMSPPLSFTIQCDIARPTPRPVDLLERKGSKRRPIASGPRPHPVSSTTSKVRGAPASDDCSTERPSLRTGRLAIASTAFLVKFWTTRSKNPGSP